MNHFKNELIYSELSKKMKKLAELYPNTLSELANENAINFFLFDSIYLRASPITKMLSIKINITLSAYDRELIYDVLNSLANKFRLKIVLD